MTNEVHRRDPEPEAQEPGDDPDVDDAPDGRQRKVVLPDPRQVDEGGDAHWDRERPDGDKENEGAPVGLPSVPPAAHRLEFIEGERHMSLLFLSGWMGWNHRPDEAENAGPHQDDETDLVPLATGLDAPGVALKPGGHPEDGLGRDGHKVDQLLLPSVNFFRCCCCIGSPEMLTVRRVDDRPDRCPAAEAVGNSVQVIPETRAYLAEKSKVVELVPSFPGQVWPILEDADSAEFFHQTDSLFFLLGLGASLEDVLADAPQDMTPADGSKDGVLAETFLFCHRDHVAGLRILFLDLDRYRHLNSDRLLIAAGDDALERIGFARRHAANQQANRPTFIDGQLDGLESFLQDFRRDAVLREKIENSLFVLGPP